MTNPDKRKSPERVSTAPGTYSRTKTATYLSSPIDTLLSRLNGVKDRGNGNYFARCPSHEDHSPSLSIRELPDSVVLLKCFGGCGPTEILGAIGLELSDLFPPHAPDPTAKRPKTPPIPWRDMLNALELDLTACSLAFMDLAHGKAFSPIDAAYIAQRADDLAAIVREVRYGR